MKERHRWDKGQVQLNGLFWIEAVILRVNQRSETYSVILLEDVPKSVFRRGDFVSVGIHEWKEGLKDR